ncbi:hypothetical protein Bca4012_089928 [Brassica carinata]
MDSTETTRRSSLKLGYMDELSPKWYRKPVDKAEELGGGGASSSLSLFNSFFFYKMTKPMREEAAGCRITIHDTGREKASSLTDHYRRRQPLL